MYIYIYMFTSNILCAPHRGPATSPANAPGDRLANTERKPCMC